jgi:hypothetical protein
MHDHQETETEETEDSVTAIYDAITDEEYEILAKWDRRGRFI